MATKNKSSQQNLKKSPSSKREVSKLRIKRRRHKQVMVIGGIVILVALAVILVSLNLPQPVNFINIPAIKTLDERSYELGPADAKITVEEYGDYQCPFCKVWHQQSQQTFIKEYIASGKSVKFIFRDYPLLDRRSTAPLKESHTTVQASYCAAEQHRFWDYHNALYDNQPASENSKFWTVDHLEKLALALKLDIRSFTSCLQSNKYFVQANSAATSALKRKVTGTPTFFVNGKVIPVSSYKDLQTAINNLLNQ